MTAHGICLWQRSTARRGRVRAWTEARPLFKRRPEVPGPRSLVPGEDVLVNDTLFQTSQGQAKTVWMVILIDAQYFYWSIFF